MRGKYSPTVSASYASDQKWFVKNGGFFDNGQNPNSDLDNDGYDSYGYSDDDGVDRAGFTEDNYILDEALFERIYLEWSNQKII